MLKTYISQLENYMLKERTDDIEHVCSIVNANFKNFEVKTFNL